MYNTPFRGFYLEVVVPLYCNYLTAHPPFSTTVVIQQICGTLQIRRTSTVRRFSTVFLPLSTSVYLLEHTRVEDGCQGVYLLLPFYLPSTSLLPLFRLSSASLPPVCLVCLPPICLPPSRLSLYPLPRLYPTIEPSIVPLTPHSELLPA